MKNVLTIELSARLFFCKIFQTNRAPEAIISIQGDEIIRSLGKGALEVFKTFFGEETVELLFSQKVYLLTVLKTEEKSLMYI